MSRISSILVVAALTVVAGCAKKPARDATTEATSGRMKSNMRVSDELAKVCNIQFDNVSRAPKFDFDEASLLPEDRDVLDQVARCITTGPLKGRGLSLVGRADPRGEVEYNMVLGEFRADTVRDYLAHLGVENERIAKTSRGELDANGRDDDGYRLDRRVDISLK